MSSDVLSTKPIMARAPLQRTVAVFMYPGRISRACGTLEAAFPSSKDCPNSVVPPKREWSPENGSLSAEDRAKRLGSQLQRTPSNTPEDTVTISLGETEIDVLVASWWELSRACTYFRGFDGNGVPRHFYLVSRAKLDISLVVPVSRRLTTPCVPVPLRINVRS